MRSRYREFLTLAAIPLPPDEPEEHVFAADEVMIESLCFLIRHLHRDSGAVRKSFVHRFALRQVVQ